MRADEIEALLVSRLTDDQKRAVKFAKWRLFDGGPMPQAEGKARARIAIFWGYVAKDAAAHKAPGVRRRV